MSKLKTAIYVILPIVLVAVIYNIYFRKNNTDLQISDKNGNGIWDDVEPFIEKHSKTKYHRLALEQVFKGIQAEILNPEIGLKESKKQVLQYGSRDTQCFIKVGEKFGDMPSIREVEAAIISNTARARAYIKYNAYFNGLFIDETYKWDAKKDGDVCDFKIDE